MAYKPKPQLACAMPAEHPLRVLVLNGTLKHAPEISNTEEVARRVVDHMGSSYRIHAEFVRLSDVNLTVGLGFRESADDDWPAIVGQMKQADVVRFATPIWWGGRSSLMQRLHGHADDGEEPGAQPGLLRPAPQGPSDGDGGARTH